MALDQLFFFQIFAELLGTIPLLSVTPIPSSQRGQGGDSLQGGWLEEEEEEEEEEEIISLIHGSEAAQGSRGFSSPLWGLRSHSLVSAVRGLGHPVAATIERPGKALGSVGEALRGRSAPLRSQQSRQRRWASRSPLRGPVSPTGP